MRGSKQASFRRVPRHVDVCMFVTLLLVAQVLAPPSNFSICLLNFVAISCY